MYLVQRTFQSQLLYMKELDQVWLDQKVIPVFSKFAQKVATAVLN